MELSDDAGSMTLSTVRSGQHGIVRALRGGRTFRSRAANLGFTAGAQVEVIQNYGSGPMIVALRGTRVALGRAEADNVLVDMIDAGAK